MNPVTNPFATVPFGWEQIPGDNGAGILMAFRRDCREPEVFRQRSSHPDCAGLDGEADGGAKLEELAGAVVDQCLVIFRPDVSSRSVSFAQECRLAYQPGGKPWR